MADDADSFISDLLKPVAHFSSEPAFRDGLQRALAFGTTAPGSPVPDHVGRFRLLQRINRSGSSAVYRAIDQSSGELVALKVLSAQRLHEPLAVSRFRREMSLVGKMHHPNLVRLIDAGESDGILFVVMELLTGCDLSQLVEKVGPIPIESASALVEQTAKALEYASQNSMVHRDVKPSNIFLTETGEVKLLDLGLVRLLTDEDESLSRSDQLLGTVDYMAPEQAFDTRQADVRSDIYSLGCTLYKLLTGHAPFSGPQYAHLLKKVLAHSSHEMRPIQGLRPDCPNALAAILERMCAKRPDDRCQCPGEVIEAVATFANREALRTLAERYRDLSVTGQAPSRQKEATLEVTAGPVQSGNPISAAERPTFTTRSQRTSLVVAAGLTSTAILAASLLKPSSDHQINGTASPTAELKTPTDMVKPATYDQGPENIAADSVVPVVPEIDRITLGSPYSGIWCINASALGTQICSGSNDGGIRFWNSAGQKVAEFRRSLETDHPVHAFALTPNGKQCLAVGFPPYVALWDVPTQRIVREFSGHTDRVWAVSISSDGGTAASAGWDGTIRIWDLHTGASIRTIEAQMGKVLAVSFLPNSHLLVAAGRVRGLFPGEIAVTTPPPLPAQQRLAPPGWLRYVHQHWNETKGTLMIPVIAAPFLLLAGSLLKPIIGLSNLAALAAAVGLLSLTTFVAYLAVRTGSYLYGHWIVTEHSTCRLARVAHDTGALAFAVLLPLVLIECPAPERGVLVTAIPKLSRLQHDLIDNRQPLPPFSKWFGNALNAFEGDPGPTPRAFQSRHGQSKLQSQQPQPQGDRERIVLEIANAYAPVLAAMQRENELATLEAQARFKQDMAELVNQPVLWRANVARVERDTVLVVAEDKIYAEADSAFKIRAVFLPQGVATTDHINWAASRIPPWVPIGKNSQIVIGEGCDETTARNLSKGQTVLIQGEISGYNDDHCLFITNSRIVSL